VSCVVTEVVFLIIKPTRCTNFSNLFLEWKSTCFGQFLCPSSGIFYCTHGNDISHTVLLTACEQEHLLLLASCQHTFMTYTIAVCTVKNSWWWTEELPETCRIHSKNKFEKLVHLFCCIVRKVTRCTVTCERSHVRSHVRHWSNLITEQHNGLRKKFFYVKQIV
jgi:hypothetical protein